MSKTIIDGLRFVLQNMRLQSGEMAKVQADIVEQAIVEMELVERKLNELESSAHDMAHRGSWVPSDREITRAVETR